MFGARLYKRFIPFPYWNFIAYPIKKPSSDSYEKDESCCSRGPLFFSWYLAISSSTSTIISLHDNGCEVPESASGKMLHRSAQRCVLSIFSVYFHQPYTLCKRDNRSTISSLCFFLLFLVNYHNTIKLKSKEVFCFF